MMKRKKLSTPLKAFFSPMKKNGAIYSAKVIFIRGLMKKGMPQGQDFR
jgi:hypothetical protein